MLYTSASHSLGLSIGVVDLFDELPKAWEEYNNVEAVKASERIAKGM